MNYTIEKVTTLIGARRYGNTDANISFILTDSRSLCFPEETLFFAIRTERNDGHNYIPELYGRGVRNFVVETIPENWATLYPNSNFLKVVGTLEALQRLAERHRDEFLIPIIGITGSNGKTMVKEWLYQLLSPEMIVTRSPRSYNSQIGVPLSVWLLNENTQIGVFEAGISKPGEMLALRDIIQPTIGVFTSLGTAHQENFSSLEAKCLEKLKLFHDTQAIVYSEDDQVLNDCISAKNYKGESLNWSAKDVHAAFFIKSIEKKDIEATVSYVWKGKVEGQYKLPFIDDASVENSITCAVVSLHLGIEPAHLAERMAKLEPVAMRLEVKEGQHGCTLINDSYNSDYNSLDIALDFMNRRPDHKGRKRTLILSDILQSGESGKELYNKVAFLCEKRGVEKFIGIGEGLLAERSAFKHLGEKHFFATINAFIHSDVFANLHDEVILLKGARQFGFDHLTELLVKKVHETVLEVNQIGMHDQGRCLWGRCRRDSKNITRPSCGLPCCCCCG